MLNLLDIIVTIVTVINIITIINTIANNKIVNINGRNYLGNLDIDGENTINFFKEIYIKWILLALCKIQNCAVKNKLHEVVNVFTI
jgi:hypothetical protein